jgi:hypothetical protein
VAAHYLLDLVNFTRLESPPDQRVNALFADKLLPMLLPDGGCTRSALYRGHARDFGTVRELTAPPDGNPRSRIGRSPIRVQMRR